MKLIETHYGEKALLLSLLCFAFPLSQTQACLWDNDTIASESARFPEVIDIISGNFPRHSREFHQWRIDRAKELIAKTPAELPPYDDLAVSQHKLGDHVSAIETMETKNRIQSAIYETYSNTGTFLIYTGDLPKSLDFIKKALSINPNAHFGREKYQLWLVEWIMAGKPDLEESPGPSEIQEFKPYGFAAFVLTKQPVMARQVMTPELRFEATRGVLGMMRFADFDNPALLEALGDLLILGKAADNASQLASLSYLHAFHKALEPSDKTRLEKKFHRARSTTLTGTEPESLTRELRDRLAKGSKFAERVRAEEIAWIQQGKNAAAEFTRKYLTR